MPHSFKNTVQEALQRLHRKKLQWERILHAWEQLGGEIKNHAHPALLRRGVMVIDVEDSNWLYFLNLRKKELKEKLNKYLPEMMIKEIRLRVR